MAEYHIPVLLNESIEALQVRSDGIYIDCTYGNGGHSKPIVDLLGAKGHLYAFDQDADALVNSFDNTKFSLIHANFRHIKRFMRLHGHDTIDGILMDLGLSSHMIDTPLRGHSFRYDAPIDLRMNQQQEFTARDLIATYSQDQIQHILGEFGEVRNAKTLAAQIVQSRRRHSINTTFQFNAVLDSVCIGTKDKYYAQVYQALRIEVNDEMGALAQLLTDSMKLLKPGGRLVAISYHSLEDRMVKNLLKSGNVNGEIEKDEYGNITRPYSLISKKAIEASAEEQKRNSRSRSAKMRVGEKN
jgi:16S rRNA (cytosine1402-N4)-methyltransferase